MMTIPMMTLLLRLRHALGNLGLASLALLAAAVMFHLVVLNPLEARNMELRQRLSRQVPAAESAQPSSAADRVTAVYRFLQKEEETTDWLAKLYGIGSATGVQLKSGNYRTHKTAGRIVRYEIALPVTGSYAQIRDFLQRSLAEIPVMSIDQLTLKRENRNDGAVVAELRLTLHMVKS
jgi:Tfp pilus assembly protein PilO